MLGITTAEAAEFIGKVTKRSLKKRGGCMKRTFKIKNQDDVNQFIKELQCHGVGMYVILVTDQERRSLEQNRLYWLHLRQIHKEGYGWGDIEKTHHALKRKFLHHIFLAGETLANVEYQINYNALLTVREHGVAIDFEHLLKKILSTKDATVGQMAEYIDRYTQYMAEKGLVLFNE